MLVKLGKQLVVVGEVSNEILTVYLFRDGKNDAPVTSEGKCPWKMKTWVH